MTAWSPEPRGDAPSVRRKPRTATATVLVAYAALVALIAGISGIGIALTPQYGRLSAAGGTAVVDLRARPTAQGWSNDLARAALPGVPFRCSSLSESSAQGRYVVVTATAPALGDPNGCSGTTSAQVDSTVALLDTESGTVRWSRDLAGPPRSLSPDPIRIDFSDIVPATRSMLVQFDINGRFVLAALDLDTGAIRGELHLPATETGIAPQIAGTLVLTGGSTSRENETAWTLCDLRSLAHPLWSGVLSTATPPLLESTALFATVGATTERIDGRSGRATRLGDGTVDLTNALDIDGTMITTRPQIGFQIMTAWNQAGRQLWQAQEYGHLTAVSRSCLLLVADDDRSTSCVDAGSGRRRWAATIMPGSSLEGIPGQTNDDVASVRDLGLDVELTMLDGATGARRYTLRVPHDSSILAAARTTLYLSTPAPSGASRIAAFDVLSGRPLWTLDGDRHRQYVLWGAQLLALSPEGTASQLTDPATRVWGRESDDYDLYGTRR